MSLKLSPPRVVSIPYSPLFLLDISSLFLKPGFLETYISGEDINAWCVAQIPHSLERALCLWASPQRLLIWVATPGVGFLVRLCVCRSCLSQCSFLILCRGGSSQVVIGVSFRRNCCICNCRFIMPLRGKFRMPPYHCRELPLHIVSFNFLIKLKLLIILIYLNCVIYFTNFLSIYVYYF